eukprot:gb/GECG01014097.1/.p1 GENE.gb/GECG01014097.1/~~gb/GECG01014097.1/.p1  ORF type:complete len:698 (+),score=65.59 gb/GECG01014097.1/:1-2094(+)
MADDSDTESIPDYLPRVVFEHSPLYNRLRTSDTDGQCLKEICEELEQKETCGMAKRKILRLPITCVELLQSVVDILFQACLTHTEIQDTFVVVIERFIRIDKQIVDKLTTVQARPRGGWMYEIERATGTAAEGVFFPKAAAEEAAYKRTSFKHLFMVKCDEEFRKAFLSDGQALRQQSLTKLMGRLYNRGILDKDKLFVCTKVIKEHCEKCGDDRVLRELIQDTERTVDWMQDFPSLATTFDSCKEQPKENMEDYSPRVVDIYTSWLSRIACGGLTETVNYWMQVENPAVPKVVYLDDLSENQRKGSNVCLLPWPRLQLRACHPWEHLLARCAVCNYTGGMELIEHEYVMAVRYEILMYEEDMLPTTSISSLSLNIQNDFTDSAFAYLQNLTSLAIPNQARTLVTDQLFKHMRNLKILDISRCCQSTITDFGFQFFQNVTRLRMDGCCQPQITDAAFRHLSGLRSLSMVQCCQKTITDAAFSHLANLKELDIGQCTQRRLTDAAFRHLSELTKLKMVATCRTTITDAAFQHLVNVKDLNIALCAQETITDEAFRHLSQVTRLDMSECFGTTITDEAFRHLASLKHLDMHLCDQSTITDAGLAHLSNVVDLRMSDCTQEEISDAGLLHLRNVTALDISGCRQSTITDAYTKLSNLKSLKAPQDDEITVNREEYYANPRKYDGYATINFLDAEDSDAGG